MRVALSLLALVLAPPVAVAAGTGGTPGPVQNRCDTAARLTAAEDYDRALKQLDKALEDAATRQCAVDGLIATTKAQAKADKDAKAKKDHDATHLTLSEIESDAEDLFLGQAWPWLAALGLLWALLAVARRVRTPRRISVRAASDDEDLAKRVVAAANVGAGGARPPARVFTGGSATLPEGTVTDLSKLLRLADKVPLGQFISLASKLPGVTSRLTVVSASAGGWATADLKLKRPLRRTRSARIAFRLGAVEDKKRIEILALAAGTWLAVVVRSSSPHLVRRRPWADAALAHACYVAGAHWQSQGDVEVARACYAAMAPTAADDRSAPFAWIGARLNEVAILTGEERWEEAAKLTADVAHVPRQLAADPRARVRFGSRELADLRRRAAYMTAVFWVSRYHAEERSAEIFYSAAAAVGDVRDEVERLEAEHRLSEADLGLLVSMRLVVLCLDIWKGGYEETLDDVRAALTPLGDRTPALALEALRAPLGAAAYYDAACAVSMLLSRLPSEPPYDDMTAPEFAEVVDTYAEEGLRLVALAVRATPASRLDRVRAMIREDPMLDPLRERASKDALAEALHEDEEPREEKAAA
jgi:hypothetical protein